MSFGRRTAAILLSVALLAGCSASTRPAPTTMTARMALAQATFRWNLPQGGIQKPSVEIDFEGKRDRVVLEEVASPRFDGRIEWLVGRSESLGVDIRAVRAPDVFRSVAFLPDGVIQSQVIQDGVEEEFQQQSPTLIRCLITGAQERLRGDPGVPRRADIAADRPQRGGNGLGGMHTKYKIAPILTGKLAAAIGKTNFGIPLAKLEAFTHALIHAANKILEEEIAVTLEPVVIKGAYPTQINVNNFAGSAEGLAAAAVTVASGGTADLAHLIAGTGGASGWAAIGSACGTDWANAATIGNGTDHGSYLDTFVHEVGHQFGAHHSFNGPGRSEFNVGYEPGAGTTLMTHNVALRAFHAASLTQMFTYLNGQSCGVSTAIPAPPTLRATPTVPIHVPIATPFSLDAELGPGAVCARIDGFDPGTTVNSEPPFFDADTGCESVRSFPSDPRSIDLPTLASRLPRAKTSLHFRLVGWSAGRQRPLASSDVEVDVVETTPFSVTSVSPVCNFAAGTKVRVSWDASGIRSHPFSASRLLAEIVYEDRSVAARVLARDLDVTVLPATLDLPTTIGRARVKLTPGGGIYFAVSDWFSVLPATACVTS